MVVISILCGEYCWQHCLLRSAVCYAAESLKKNTVSLQLDFWYNSFIKRIKKYYAFKKKKKITNNQQNIYQQNNGTTYDVQSFFSFFILFSFLILQRQSIIIILPLT